MIKRTEEEKVRQVLLKFEAILQSILPFLTGDDRYERDRRDRDRRRNERGGRYDEDYDQQRRTGTKSGRSNREDPRYAANYYQQPGKDLIS